MSSVTHRLGKIIQQIGANPGITLTELRSRLEAQGITVTERTIAKDILALKHEYGLLPAKERLRSGYVLNNVVSLPEDDLQIVTDVLAVFASRFNDKEAARLLARLGYAAKTRTREVRQRDIYATNEAIQNTLLAAIRARQAVSMEYVTPRLEKPQGIKCFPLLMVFHERGWYCITRELKAKKYHPRRLDRVRSCSAEDTRNDSHDDDVAQAEFLMSCGWGMTFPRNLEELQESDDAPPIVARFERTVAPYILESLRRHPRGTVSAAKDGSGDALLKIRLSDPQEFLYWIRSFGARAWIVSPQTIVEKEKAEIRRMQQRYQ
jgi:predicted DNA-binding transcriptional regulator YafY